MKKIGRLLMILFLMLTMALGLCACGEDSGRSSGSSKKHAQKDDDEDEEDEDEEEEEEEDDEDDEAEEDIEESETDRDGENTQEHPETEFPDAGEKLGIYLQRHDEYSWDHDTHELLIRYQYEQIALSADTRAKYPELAKKMLVVNDLIATEEANCYMSDDQYVSKLSAEEKKLETEDETLPLKNTWEIMIRRADEQLLSFQVRFTDYRGEYIRTRYTNYNIIPETGEELSLDDVLADSETVYDMIAEKLIYSYTDYLTGGDEDAAANRKTVAEEVQKELESGMDAGWLLGPEGISFTFDPMVFAPFDAVIPIAFSDDTDGTLFQDAWRYPEGEDWVIRVPLYDEILFDADEDGRTDSLIVQDKYSGYPDTDPYEDWYLSGLDVYFNDNDGTEIDLGEELTIEDMYLVHRSGRSFLMVEYSEYDWTSVDVFCLKTGKIERTDGVTGWFTRRDEEPAEDEEYLARPFPADPSDLTICVLSETLSMLYLKVPYDLTTQGKLVARTGVVEIDEQQQYILTLKTALKGVPVVDRKTRREMGDTVDLKKGDTLRLMYTDMETYVDCKLEDDSFVRIYVMTSEDEDDEFWKYVLSGGKKQSLYDTFDGMFFAG